MISEHRHILLSVNRPEMFTIGLVPGKRTKWQYLEQEIFTMLDGNPIILLLVFRGLGVLILCIFLRWLF